MGVFLKTRGRKDCLETKRETIPELEELIDQKIPVLDHGFLILKDYMGSDQSIVDAARISYGKGTKSVSDDAKLINYLMSNNHTSPFEQCEIKLHLKLPIFVARQLIRHRTASLNEYSGRYSVMDSDCYIPNPENIKQQSKSNKQGRDGTLGEGDLENILASLKDDSEIPHEHYNELLNRYDLSRELARIILPLNTYTQWYWKIDLHNLFHFLKLRCDPHAQYEIRIYAEEILRIVQLWCPLAFEAFMNYKMDSLTISRDTIKILRDQVDFQKLDFTGLPKREREQILTILGKENED